MASKSESKSEKRPDPFDDLHTQRDDQAVPGHFAEVVSGEHKGRYGVVIQPTGKDEVVLKTRDASGENLTVKFSDLRPAESGRR